MKTLHSVSIVILLALLPLTSAQAQRAGGESGGGGGVLLRASGPLLIDFLNIDLNFKDQMALSGKTASRLQTPIAGAFKLTEATMPQIRREHAAFDYVIETLEAWQAMKFDIAGTRALSALKEPVQWSFVEDTLLAGVFFPQGVSPQEPVGIAAYYHAAPANYTVRISRSLWNQMGLMSQAGLIVHEGLRHLQIAVSDNFDEQSLQRATALLIMCEPRPRLGYYIRYLMFNAPEKATKLYGEFDQFVQTDCKRRL